MTTRKRILFVDNLAVESARRQVYRALAARSEFEIHLLTPESWQESGKPIASEDEPDENLHIHRSRILFGYRTHRVIYTDLFRAIRNINPDLLCIDAEPENYSAVEASLARNFLKPSMKLGLVSSRIVDHTRQGFPFRLSFTHQWCDRIIRKKPVDLLFVRAKTTANLMAAYASKVCLLPHAVDCSVFKKLSRKSENDKIMTIGFIGRLIEAKGIHLLIQTLAQLPENVHLHIVGKGSDERKLRNLARSLNLVNRTTFVPPVGHNQIPALLNTMDILVLPSLNTRYWSEQFGRVLIEAMACEVPVVAANSGGIPDVIGDAGILFRVGDVDDLLAKLSHLVNSEAMRSEMSMKGRHRVLTNYDVSIIGSRMGDAILRTFEEAV